MARNKRLHVEMTLIKLTFLQQAIELSYDNQSATVIKKKRINNPVAVKFEPIQSMQFKGAPTAAIAASPSPAKLYIETKEPVKEVAEPLPLISSGTKLAETPASSKETNDTLVKEPGLKKIPIKPEGTAGKKSLLDSLRDKHITNKTTDVVKEAVTVTEDNLKEHWKCFTAKLKKQFKHSVVTVFNNAELTVVNDQHFSITVSATLEQKFIEQEKLPLLEYLKERFQNKNIGFTIHINDVQKEIVVSEATLTTREKYQKIIEQYPLIKELKDRLRLELDY
jgi:DNA polymerase-3 subunit gamma/tau